MENLANRLMHLSNFDLQIHILDDLVLIGLPAAQALVLMSETLSFLYQKMHIYRHLFKLFFFLFYLHTDITFLTERDSIYSFICLYTSVYTCIKSHVRVVCMVILKCDEFYLFLLLCLISYIRQKKFTISNISSFNGLCSVYQ